MKEYNVQVFENKTEWRVNDKLHREDGPAVENMDGTKRWYLNGLLHREDGPAVEWYNGTKYWYKNGKHHRDDGPAVEYPDGDSEWYLNGVLYTEAEFLAKTQPAKELTVAEIETLLGYKVKIIAKQ